MSLFQRLLRDREGATAIEYGLIAVFVGIGLMAAMGSLGNALSSTFTTVGSKMANANNTASG
jgi:pilus assembly protein Flp/PilA